ncbi:response regulator transcription factor [Microbacterium murale]|uniref:DNA-binding response regulator n=1 Tax=Microbacterium murale TaxID=1081040 RepID=A0ABQ1RR53_9MICO|nr:response regulator transcription factor [Microbacterium murale]GGD75314.1 DNA-binding response regulator [Microbacterium murale]
MHDAAQTQKTAVIVEDDQDVRDLLVRVLQAAGFATVAVDNGIDGVNAVLTHQPLITTLDVNMPGIDGFEAARRIRTQSDTYIIMLSALDEEADVVLGLSAGADEYLNKPFRPRELRARIEALLRRPRTGTVPAVPASSTAAAPQVAASAAPTTMGIADSPTSTPPSDMTVLESAHPGGPLPAGDDSAWVVHRDLRLDPETRIALIEDRVVELTRTEFDLLHALMESKRRVRSKVELTLVLRGESYLTTDFVGEADKRAIEAHMTNLRRKLGDAPTQPRYIETVRGVGYRLTSERA